MKRFLRRRIAILFAAAVVMSGCVGMDVGAGPREKEQRHTYASLNSEQRWELREAARGGDHELVATVSRMAWDNPHQAIELGNYAAALRPESAAEITGAVTRAVAR
jgi:hypothetical protein